MNVLSPNYGHFSGKQDKAKAPIIKEPFISFNDSKQIKAAFSETTISKTAQYEFIDENFEIGFNGEYSKLSKKNYLIIKSLYGLTFQNNKWVSSQDILDRADLDTSPNTTYLSQIFKGRYKHILDEYTEQHTSRENAYRIKY